jgi:8-hydroxy-5-deazaflavin:NADPH oxidoreductase
MKELPMVDVAVVGVGRVGGTLACAWHRAGLDVALAGRELDSSTIISLAASFGLRRLTVSEALARARVVVVADPLDTIDTLFGDLVGADIRAVVVDASPGDRELDSDLGHLRAALCGTPVYRAFNTLTWSDYVDPDYGGTLPDLFYAGPDDEPREAVEGLVGALGLRAVYVGGYEQIELVDSLAALRTAVARHRPGHDVAVKLLERLL